MQKLDGTWTQSLTELDHECQDHFQYLFAAPSAPTQSMIDNRQALLTHVKPIMQQHDAFSLEQPFTAEELHDALLHLGKGKSPRWDGLAVEFYLAFWDDLKDFGLGLCLRRRYNGG